MKTLLIIAIVFICISFGRNPDNRCKIVQRYYLNGKLILLQSYDSIIIEHGCMNYLSVNGKATWADSIVTTLK